MNIELPMRLLDWIKETDLDWKGLSSNPSCEAIQMLKKNPTKIKFYYLIENKNVDSIKILHLFSFKTPILNEYIINNSS